MISVLQLRGSALEQLPPVPVRRWTLKKSSELIGQESSVAVAEFFSTN
jgi:hypothetical protein